MRRPRDNSGARDFGRAKALGLPGLVLDGLIERYGLAGELLGDVVAGAVIKHSRDFNLTRECVLSTKLAPERSARAIRASTRRESPARAKLAPRRSSPSRIRIEFGESSSEFNSERSAI